MNKRTNIMIAVCMAGIAGFFVASAGADVINGKKFYSTLKQDSTCLVASPNGTDAMFCTVCQKTKGGGVGKALVRTTCKYDPGLDVSAGSQKCVNCTDGACVQVYDAKGNSIGGMWCKTDKKACPKDPNTGWFYDAKKNC